MSWVLYFIFNFVLYSFLGWVLEEVYCFAITGAFKEDRFLFGPLKPMYGFAISILIFFYDYLGINGVLIIPFLVIIPTTVEYISGLGLRIFVGKDYWDYKNKKYNLHGLICLKFTIYWAILSAFVLLIIQPIIKSFYLGASDLFNIMGLLISLCMVIDLAVTIRSFANKKIAKG